MFTLTMTSLKKWAERIWLGIDAAVAEIEDHDALVVSALNDVRRAMVNAHARLDEVRLDGVELRARLASERHTAERWRALAQSEDDDEQALDALRHARRAEARAARARLRTQEHGRVAERLEEYMAALGDRIAGLEEQLEVVRARAVHAQAAPDLDADQGALTAALERWESTLMRAQPQTDVMDEAFDVLRRDQQEVELRSELQALRRERKGHART